MLTSHNYHRQCTLKNQDIKQKHQDMLTTFAQKKINFQKFQNPFDIIIGYSVILVYIFKANLIIK